MRKPTIISKYRIIDGHVEFSYCMLLTNLIINPSRAVLTVLLGPLEKQCSGAHTYTVASTHRNKTANVDRIKHKFIVFKIS